MVPSWLYDPDTGLVRFGRRDYDPDTGRFTALDPLGDAGGDSDWYGYCLDDPVNLVDPSGLFVFGTRALDHLGFLRGEGVNSLVGHMLPVGPFGDVGEDFKEMDDQHNLQIVHEQGFYEDGSGDNVGLFPKGKGSDDHPQSDYQQENTHYDDKRMRRAVKAVDPGNYNLLLNNCQDYADKLREKYRELEHRDNVRRGH